MNIKNFFCLCFVFCLIACNDKDGLHNQTINAKVIGSGINSYRQKINIEYEIVGEAIINKPVGINIYVSYEQPGQDIVLYYRINAENDLKFGDNQIETVNLLPLSDGNYPLQQVIVVPKREGRVFLVVSAEIESTRRIDSTSMAVPIDAVSNFKIDD